jgi:hypothetical protein
MTTNLRCVWLLIGMTLAGRAWDKACGTTTIDAPPTAFPSGYSVQGDTVLNVRDGAQIFGSLSASSGGTINMYGGQLTQGLDVCCGGYLNIFDGLMGGISSNFYMSAGSQTTMHGGRFTTPILKQSTAGLIIEGVDFEIQGAPVPGLLAPGNEVSISIPLGKVFAGVFANGSPFTFYGEATGGDEFFGQVTLLRSARPTGPPVVSVPTDPVPPGVLPGQTLIVETGAQLPPGMNAARGSILDVRGGLVQTFEGYGADIRISGGQTSGVLSAYLGTTVHVTGGQSSTIIAYKGAQVFAEGGSISRLNAYAGSTVEVGGGVISNLYVDYQGSATMRGGQVAQSVELAQYQSTFQLFGGTLLHTLSMPEGSHVTIGGGRIGTGDFAQVNAGYQSELTLIGRQFLVNGSPVSGLMTNGVATILANRNGELLDAILSDGSPFKIYLGFGPPINPNTQPPLIGLVSSQATLRLVLVPEPSTVPLVILSFFFCVGATRRPDK